MNQIFAIAFVRDGHGVVLLAAHRNLGEEIFAVFDYDCAKNLS